MIFINFLQARNLLIVCEFRNTDTTPNKPGLSSFYKRPGPPGNGPFTNKVSTSVLYHNDRPEFYEEVSWFLKYQKTKF